MNEATEMTLGGLMKDEPKIHIWDVIGRKQTIGLIAIIICICSAVVVIAYDVNQIEHVEGTVIGKEKLGGVGIYYIIVETEDRVVQVHGQDLYYKYDEGDHIDIKIKRRYVKEC